MTRIAWLLAVILLIAGNAFATTYYIDPNYSGGGSTGADIHPWTSLASGWSTINMDLATVDVTVYYAACNPACNTANTSTTQIDLSLRTSSSTHILTLDGATKYPSSTSAPASPWNTNATFSTCTGYECAKTASWMTGKKFTVTANPPITSQGSVSPSSCGKGYETIQGFKFIGNGANQGADFAYIGNLTVQYNEFTETTGASSGPTVIIGDGNNGPCVSGGTPTTQADNVTFQYNYDHDGYGEGLYIGASTSDPQIPNGDQQTQYTSEGLNCTINCATGANYVIQYNTIESTAAWGGQGDGIDVKDGHSNLTIRGNTLRTSLNSGLGSNSPHYGADGQGIVAESASVIEGNYVETPCHNGIVLSASWDNQTGRSTATIRNNIIINLNSTDTVMSNYSCGTVGGRSNGIDIGEGNSGTCNASPAYPFSSASMACWASLTIYNNTIYNTPADSAISSDSNDTIVNSTTTVTNNIAHTTGGITGTYTGGSKDHNDCFTGTTGCTGTGTITTDPLLVGAGSSGDTNYAVQSSSPTKAAGANLHATFTGDYFGNTRPNSAFTIGADELNPVGGCTPSKVVFTAQPGNADLGSTLGTVSVSVEDSGSNVCTSDTSTVALAKHGGSCTGMSLSGTASGAASAGVFTTSNLSITGSTGSCSLDATDGSLTSATSNTFTISCTPSKLVFTAQPSNAVMGVSIGTVSASVENTNTIVCTADTSTVTLSKHAGTCTGMTLNGTVSGAASSGVFSTSNVNMSVATGACSLDAADGALTGATSNSFTISSAVGGGARLRLR